MMMMMKKKKKKKMMMMMMIMMIMIMMHFPTASSGGGFVQSKNQISTTTISLLQADRAAVVASREDGPVSKRGNVIHGGFDKVADLSPIHFRKKSRQRWVPKDLNWFTEFGFDSSKSTKPWA